MEDKNEIKLLLEIFLAFFKIGSFTFGGGYAMMPLIEKEVVNNKNWVKEEEIIDVFAVSQSLPGAIAINSSTFIGYKIAGKKGATVATLGVILPSLMIITIIAAFFTKFQHNQYVRAAFAGIRPTIVGLILLAAIKIGKNSIKDKLGIVVALLSAILVTFTDIQAIYIIIGGAVIGLIIYKWFPHKVDKIVNRGGRKN